MNLNIHSLALHQTIVLCCCFCIGALTVKENSNHRIKKHENNQLHHSYEEESLSELFIKYGHDGSMTYEAFKELLKNLGLGGSDGDSHTDHAEHGHAEHDHAEHDHAEHEPDYHGESDHDTTQQCLDSKELYDGLDKNNTGRITQNDMRTICPVLLHQIDSKACEHHDHGEEQPVPAKHVWGYGFASVTIISLISITGIILVPCTMRFPVFYTNLISFLVAVAIGALMGDALLHLLPHSYGLHSHEGHKEGEEESVKASTIVWRGTVSIAGILLFFICEKLMHLRKEKESCKKKQSNDDTDKAADQNGKPGTEPLMSNREPLMSGCRSIPRVVFKRPSLQKNHNDAHLIHIHNNHQVHQLYESSDIPMEKLECGEDTCEVPCEDDSCPDGKCENQSECDGNVANDVHNNTSDNVIHIEPADVVQEDSEIQSLGHGHSHKHSHGHSHDHGFTGGIATVAWMVVMGDGLHNFCDGIAIGAAFANSTTGGISTSIAIFCHEIPHEVGDFAVMLKAGMSVKKALAYMGLSSILAYIGMILGIAIGNIEEANLWIFALAGGMFLYIALVDLLPELLESADVHLNTIALQSFGIVFGMCIMIIIALYEEDIQEALA